ncbi:radical SAM family heme chaperone HemW [Proteinivorax hydrogeniformans]|uniref:Heme chaperone HemW n=1 Tax=Proteinivorax hydrogeniformans TaxID=1826727 RepID=A0AAU8HWK3_9FIRM
MSGLYIHIPYCNTKCSYCDFVSYTNTKTIDKYINALKNEITLNQKTLKDLKPSTIFIGGGTPTLVPVHLMHDLFKELSQVINISDVKEWTIEANPKTISLEKLNAYKQIGINRISLGVQSLQQGLLDLISRKHTPAEAIKAIQLAQGVGFENISVDLLYGLPNQTTANILDDIKRLVNEEVKHISFYGLQLEEGTPLHERVNSGRITLPKEEDIKKQYLQAVDLLTNYGYKQYEISNFSKPNFKSLHNLGYWNRGNYLGLGVASHSKIAKKRFYNTNSLNEYLSTLEGNKLPIKESQVLKKSEEKLEQVMLKLRTDMGIPLKQFTNCPKFSLYHDNLISNSLAVNEKGTLKLTANGYLLSNKIIADLWNFIE